jgi:hypothetical protein
MEMRVGVPNDLTPRNVPTIKKLVHRETFFWVVRGAPILPPLTQPVLVNELQEATVEIFSENIQHNERIKRPAAALTLFSYSCLSSR